MPRKKKILDLPRVIKVGGHKIKIIHPADNLEEMYIARYSHATGVMEVGCFSDKGEYISKSYALVAFLHELLHALDHISGHCLFNKNEKALDGIVEGLLQVIKSNPKIRNLFSEVE